MKILMGRIGLAVVVLGMAVLQAGCAGKFTGGGFLDSRAGAPAKATFGFNVQAEDEDGDLEADAYKGQFQYRDHGSFPAFPAGVGIHGKIDQVDLGEDIGVLELGFGGLFFDFGPEGLFGNVASFSGTYTPQPKKLGEGGVIEGIIIDSGVPGVEDPTDFIVVHLVGGVYDGYANGGFLQGGNIQYHPPGEDAD